MTDDKRDPLASLWQQQEVPAVTMTMDEVSAFERRLHKGVRFRVVSEIAMAIVCVAFFGAAAWHAADLGVRLALVVACLGVVFVAWRVAASRHVERPADGTTVAYLVAVRAELGRQATLMRTVSRWYLGPLVPGYVLLHLAVAWKSIAAGVPKWSTLAVVAGGLLFGAAVFVLVVFVNRLGAKRLERKMAALPTIASTRSTDT